MFPDSFFHIPIKSLYVHTFLRLVKLGLLKEFCPREQILDKELKS